MEGETTTISNTSSSENSVHSISILLIDDDLTCLSIVAAMLKKFKYEVVTAKHPKDALCTMRIKGGTFDLVVSDVHMPDMDGFELQKVIEQEFNLPVVLMSADDREDIVSKGLDNGAALFITKPVSEEDLRDIWQCAGKNKKIRVIVEEIEHVPDLKTSLEKINSDEITASDSSDDEDMNEKKDSEKKIPKTESDENRREISGSSSQKKPKLVWTDSLHNRFLEAIRKIGLDKAVPKKILEVMAVPGLTRENVASHLQKYRIFLRRVTDASYEIQYGSDEGLTRSFGPRLGLSDSSVSILSNFTKNNYQNPGRFPYSPSSLLTGSGLARLLSDKGNFLKPNATTPNLLIHHADRSHVRFGQDSNQTASVKNRFSTEPLETLSMHGLTASFNGSSSKENTRTSSNVFQYRTNYVGYRMSNLKHLNESGFSKKNQDLKSSSGVIDLPHAEFQRNNLDSEANFQNERTNIYDILDQCVPGSTSTPSLPNKNGGKQLSDVVADYQMLITNSNLPLQNQDGIREAYSPLFDLDEFDLDSTEQSLHVGTELYHTTLADQTSFENQEQAHQVHQPRISQAIDTISQLGESHQTLDQHQTWSTDFTDSLEFNACSQLDDILLSPTEVEDREFLESLLTSFPGENQTLDGV